MNITRLCNKHTVVVASDVTNSECYFNTYKSYTKFNSVYTVYNNVWKYCKSLHVVLICYSIYVSIRMLNILIHYQYQPNLQYFANITLYQLRCTHMHIYTEVHTYGSRPFS